MKKEALFRRFRLLQFTTILSAAAVCLPALSSAFAVNEAGMSPNFSLSSGDGSIVNLSDFRGKVVYLDFWASWCGPCRHTLPWMQSLQKKFKSRGLEVVAVNVDIKKADAEKLLDGLDRTFTVLYDPSGIAATKFNPPSMPTSYLIDTDGRIALVHAGFHDGDDQLLEGEIVKLLQPKR